MAEGAQPIDSMLAVLIRRRSRSSDPVAADDVPGGQHKRRWVWEHWPAQKLVEQWSWWGTGVAVTDGYSTVDLTCPRVCMKG
jgi:hypothetical protein